MNVGDKVRYVNGSSAVFDVYPNMASMVGTVTELTSCGSACVQFDTPQLTKYRNYSSGCYLPVRNLELIAPVSDPFTAYAAKLAGKEAELADAKAVYEDLVVIVQQMRDRLSTAELLLS